MDAELHIGLHEFNTIFDVRPFAQYVESINAIFCVFCFKNPTFWFRV
jgi:hypothetical protein